MIGYLIAILRIIISSTLGITQKKLLTKDTNSFYLSILAGLVSAVIMSVSILFIEINLTKMLIIAVIFSGILNIIAGLSMFFAIKHTDISLLYPLLTLIPVLTAINGIIFLEEFLTIYEVLGMALILSGALILNNKKGKNIFSSFIELFKSKGLMALIIIILAYSFSSIFDKIGVENSTPLEYSVLLWIFMGIIMIIIISILMILKKDSMAEIKKFKDKKLSILTLSILGLLVTITTMVTFKYLPVGVSLSLFKMESIALTFFGKVMFNEKENSKRLIASIIMALGAALIFIK